MRGAVQRGHRRSGSQEEQTDVTDPAGIPAPQDAILHLECVDSRHLATVRVHEQHGGATDWEGNIDVFEGCGERFAEAIARHVKSGHYPGVGAGVERSSHRRRRCRPPGQA
jgi:hypothetical protein